MASAGRGAETFTAPIMEIPALVETAKKMLPDIQLTEADLRSPRSFHLIYIFEQVLKDLQVNFDSVRQTHWQDLPAEYSEGFEDALPLVRFGKFMVNFMAKIGVPDFQFKDIINPQPKRTRRFLSSLFNYWNLAESQMEKYDEISKKASEAKEGQLRLQSAIEGYRREINEIKKKAMEEEPLYMKIKEDIDVKHTEFENLTKEARQLKEKFATIKLHGTEVASAKVELSLKIQKSKQENATLTNQIVHSPELLKEELGQERQRLDGLVEDKRQLQLRLQELVEHRESLKGIHDTLRNFDEIMENIAQQLEIEREVDRRVKEARTNTQRLQRGLSDKRIQVTDLTEKLKTRQERQAASELQLAARMDSLQQKLKSLQSDAEMVEQFHTERDIVLMDIEEKQEAVLKETEAVNLKADKNEDFINAQFCKLMSEVDDFNTRSVAEIMEFAARMKQGRLADEEKLRKLEELDVFTDDPSLSNVLRY